MYGKWKSIVAAALSVIMLSGCAQAQEIVEMVESTISPEQATEDALPKSSVIRSGTSIRRSDMQQIQEIAELVDALPENTENAGGTAAQNANKPSISVEVDADPSDITVEPGDGASVTTIPMFPWPESFLPYRSMLSKQDKLVYDEIYANVSNMTSRFPLKSKATPRTISNIVRAVIYDHPDLFWLDSSYRFGYTSRGVVTEVQISFNKTAQNIEQAQREFEQAAEEILRKAVLLKTDWEKEKFVHDYLLDNVTYDLRAPNNQSAYSALVTGASVCAGYAKAFQYIMMKLNIPCYYCVGFAGEDHAWNLIRLDGKFYNVDVAWDDPDGNEVGTYNYDYFNLSDRAILKDHRRTEMAVYLPVAMESAPRPAA